MFEVDGVSYTLKFNKQKLKTIELTANTSVIGEITKNNGILRYSLIEQLFSFGLVEEKTNEAVKQKKALELFEGVVEKNGLISLNMAIIKK